MEGETDDGLEMSHYNFGTQNPSWITKEGNMCEAMKLICNNNKGYTKLEVSVSLKNYRRQNSRLHKPKR